MNNKILEENLNLVKDKIQTLYPNIKFAYTCNQTISGRMYDNKIVPSLIKGLDFCPDNYLKEVNEYLKDDVNNYEYYTFKDIYDYDIKSNKDISVNESKYLIFFNDN